MGILQVKNLSLAMGDKKILNGLSIDFWEGSVHAIMGTNGAGKSTLAYTIMGLSDYQHFDGDLIFDGKSLKGLPIDQRARMGITLGWQEPARFDGLTIKSFLLASAKDKTEQAINRALEQVGLDPNLYLSRAVDKTLSGGERKRVELASLLVMQPKLLILDEPDSGIDMAALEMIFEAIKYFKAQGTTVILITHSMAVLKQAEHAFLICHGEVIDKGSVEKISGYFENKCLPCGHKNDPDEEEESINE